MSSFIEGCFNILSPTYLNTFYSYFTEGWIKNLIIADFCFDTGVHVVTSGTDSTWRSTLFLCHHYVVKNRKGVFVFFKNLSKNDQIIFNALQLFSTEMLFLFIIKLRASANIVEAFVAQA